MPGRILKWVAGVVAVAAAIGMGIYLAIVGLNEASQLATVAGAFISLAGLALAVYGIIAARRLSTADSADGAVDNVITGGTFHGSVNMAGQIGSVGSGHPGAPQAQEPGARDHPPAT